MEAMRNGLAAAAVLAATAGPALAQQGPGFYHDHPHMMGGWFGGLVMLLLFVGLSAGAVFVLLRLFGPGGSGRSPGRALEILDERFARGEIDRAEYEERRKALTADAR